MDAPDDRDEDDVLETGARSPRWTRMVERFRPYRHVPAVVVGLGLIITLLVQVAPDGTVAGQPSLALPRHQVTGPTADPSHSRGYDAPILAVQSLARQRGPLHGYERQTSPAGACTLVRPGHSPVHRIARRLHRAAPHYRRRQIAEVLDQFTGLCSLEVRERNDRGDVLVLSIASPTRHSRRTSTAPVNQLQTGFELAPGATTKFALVRQLGFRVLVGATGPARWLPDARTLVSLAQDPALTW